MAYYISFLKALALRINASTIHFFFNPDKVFWPKPWPPNFSVNVTHFPRHFGTLIPLEPRPHVATYP